MATIKISDLDLRKDSPQLAKCTSDEEYHVVGGAKKLLVLGNSPSSGIL